MIWLSTCVALLVGTVFGFKVCEWWLISYLVKRTEELGRREGTLKELNRLIEDLKP